MATLYPMLLRPTYRQADCGSTLLGEHFQREMPPTDRPVFESVELSDREGEQSVVAAGPLADRPLAAVIADDPRAYLGPRREAGAGLPIRCCFTSTERRLALQVHPDEGVSVGVARPRTQLWYVVAARPDAQMTVGIRGDCTRLQFINTIATPRAPTLIQAFPAEAGDAYYLPPGRVHALGPGALLFVVAQRDGRAVVVSDWGDGCAAADQAVTGHPDAMTAINFQDRRIARIRREAGMVTRSRKLPIMVHCPFFSVEEWRLFSEIRERTLGNTFHFLVALEGGIDVLTEGMRTQVERGQCCFVPAACEYYTIRPARESTTFLKVGLRT